MPLYEYQGQQYDISTDDPNEAKSKILAHLGVSSTPSPQAPENTSLWQDVKIGAENVAHTGKDALDMLAGAAARISGFEDSSDKIYDDMIARQKSREQEMKGYDQGFGGKVVSGLTGIVPMLAAAPVVGPLAAAGGMAGMSALSQGGKNIQGGASTSGAITQAIGEGALDTAAMAFPIGKGLLAGAGYGAGGNVLSQLGQDVLATQTMPDTEASKFYHLGNDKDTLEKYAIQAITGGVPGGVFGKMNAKGKFETAPKIEEPSGKVSDTQRFDTSLNERTVQLETAIRKGESELTRLGSKKNLSEAELARFENILKDVEENKSQLNNLKGIKPEETVVKPEEPVTEEITLKPLDDIESKSAEKSVPEDIARLDQELNDSLSKQVPIETHPEAVVPDAAYDGSIPNKWEPPVESGLPVKTDTSGETLSPLQMKAKAAFTLTKLEQRLETVNQRISDYESGKSPAGTVDSAGLYALRSKLENAISYYESVRDKASAVAKDKIAKKEATKKTEATPVEKTKAVETLVDKLDVGMPKAKAYVDALGKGDILGALKAIYETSLRPEMTALAEALMRHTSLGERKIKLADKIKSLGTSDWFTGDIGMGVRSLNSPIVFLHEVVHSITAGRIESYAKGDRFDPITNRAISGLFKLHADLSSKHLQKFVDALGQDRAEAWLKNPHELLAHGLTNNQFQAVLREIKLNEKSGLSKLVEQVAGVFGFTKTEMNALKKVYELGDDIISNSKGETLDKSDPRWKGYKELDIPFDSVEKIDAKINRLGAKINGKLFTAQLKSIYGDNPVVKAADKILQTAERRMDTLINTIFGGTPNMNSYKKSNSFFFTLKKLQESDGLIPAVLKASYPEIHGVVKALQEGHDNGRPYAETLERAGLNETQRKLADNLITAVTKLHQAENALRAKAGLKPIPFRQGYFPAIRRGDHTVIISKNGTPYHLESFLSKTEADAFIKKNAKLLGDDTISYEARKPNDNTENVMKLFDDIQAAIEEGRSLDSLRGDYSTDQAGVTTHAMRRTGMPGFIGTEIGLTPEQSGKRFADNIESYVREYAESIRKREVMLDTDKLLAQNKDVPNASNVVKTMRDYSIGKTGEVQWLKDAGTWWKEKVDSFVVNNPQFKGKLDVHAWDRMSGFLSHIFYAHTLTMRPSIWVAQVLTYFNSLRGLGREDISPLNAMLAAGESWTALARGKHVSKDLVDGIQYVSQNLNTFHPQLTNQLNRLSFGRDPESNANKILHILTGEKQSSSSDTVSRFMTWMTFYHAYQKMGFEGKELWHKAAEASDENMFVYARSHQPGIYRDLGIVGEQMSPLKTFAHGQLGLLVSDLRNFINQPNAKTAVPVALTAMTAVIFGGAISAPIVAEYELLRKLAVHLGIIGEDDFPSVTKVLLEKPEWLSHGLVSSTTGMDIGASMRYNSLIGNLATAQNMWSALFPASGFAGTMAVNASELLGKKAKGTLTEGEKYNHLKKMVPKGPAWAAVDETVFDSHNRDMIPFGKRGEALTPQTDEAIWAARMGSRSLQEAKDSTKNLLNREEEKKRNEKKAKAVDLMLDGKIDIARDMLVDAEVDPHTIKSMISSQLDRKERPVLDRFYTNKKGGVTSYEQKRKLLEMVGYLENQRD